MTISATPSGTRMPDLVTGLVDRIADRLIVAIENDEVGSDDRSAHERLVGHRNR